MAKNKSVQVTEVKKLYLKGLIYNWFLSPACGVVFATRAANQPTHHLEHLDMKVSPSNM